MNSFSKSCHSVPATKTLALTVAVTKLCPKIRAFITFLCDKSVVIAKHALYWFIFISFSFYYLSKSNRVFSLVSFDKGFRTPILRDFFYFFCQFYKNLAVTVAVTKKGKK